MPSTLSGVIQDEMEARGWSEDDVMAMLPDPVDKLCASFAIHYDDLRASGHDVRLDEHTAKVLSRVFDVSSGFFLNLTAMEAEDA